MQASLDDTQFSHDLDGDGIDDFHINIRDNDDEIAPAPNAPGNDIDGRVYVISTCDKFPDNPRQVIELAKFTAGGGACYNGAGGCDGNGNSN